MLRAIVPGNESVFSLLRSASQADSSHERLLLLDTIRDAVLSASPSSLKSLRAEFTSDLELLCNLFELLNEHDDKEAESDLPEPFLLLSVIARLFPPSEEASLSVWCGGKGPPAPGHEDPTVNIVVEAGLINLIRAGLDCEDFSGRTTLAALEVLRNFLTLSIPFCKKVIVTLDVRNIVIGLLNCPVSDIVLDDHLSTYVNIRTAATAAVGVLLFHHPPSVVSLESAVVVNIMTGVMHAIDLELLAMKLVRSRARGRVAAAAAESAAPPAVHSEARFVDGPVDDLLTLFDAQLAAVVMLCVSDAPRIPLAAQATFGEAPLLLLVRAIDSGIIRVAQVRDTAHALRLVLGPKRMRESRAEACVRLGVVGSLLQLLTVTLPTIATTGRDNGHTFADEPRSAVFPAVMSCMRTLVALLQCNVPAARGSVLLSAQLEALLALYLPHPPSPYIIGRVQEGTDADLASPTTMEAAVSSPMFPYLHAQALSAQAMDLVDALIPSLLGLPECDEPGGVADRLTEYITAHLCAVLISVPLNAGWIDPVALPVPTTAGGMPSDGALAAGKAEWRLGGEIIPHIFEGSILDGGHRTRILERAQHNIYLLAKRPNVRRALVLGALLPVARQRLFVAMQTACPTLYELTVRLMERLRDDPDNNDVLDAEELITPSVNETVVARKIQSQHRAAHDRTAFLEMTTAVNKFVSSALWEKERTALDEDEARSTIADRMQALIATQLATLRAQLALLAKERETRVTITRQWEDTLAVDVMVMDESAGRRVVAAAAAAAVAGRVGQMRATVVAAEEIELRTATAVAEVHARHALARDAFAGRAIVTRQLQVAAAEAAARALVAFESIVDAERIAEINLYVALNDGYALLRGEQRLDRWLARCKEAQGYLLHEFKQRTARTMLVATTAMESAARRQLEREWQDAQVVVTDFVARMKDVGAAIETRQQAYVDDHEYAINFQQLLLRETKERSGTRWLELRTRVQRAEEYARATTRVLEDRGFRGLLTSTAQDHEESRRLVIIAGERRALVPLAWFPQWASATHAIHTEEAVAWRYLVSLSIVDMEAIQRSVFNFTELTTHVFKFAGRFSQFNAWAHAHIAFVTNILGPFVSGLEATGRTTIEAVEDAARDALLTAKRTEWVGIVVGDEEDMHRRSVLREAAESHFGLQRHHVWTSQLAQREVMAAAQWDSRVRMVYDYAMDTFETHARDAIVAEWVRETRGAGPLYANIVMATTQMAERREIEASELRFRAYIEEGVGRSVLAAELQEVVAAEAAGRTQVAVEQAAAELRSLQEAELVFVSEPSGRVGVAAAEYDARLALEARAPVDAESADRAGIVREALDVYNDVIAKQHACLLLRSEEAAARDVVSASEAQRRINLAIIDLTARETILRSKIHIVYRAFSDGAVFQQGSTALAQREWSRRHVIEGEEEHDRRRVQDSLFVSGEKTLFGHHLRVRALLQMEWAVQLSRLRAEIARVRIDAEEEPSRRAEIVHLERERFGALCGHAAALAERVGRQQVADAEALHRAMARVEAAEAIERALMESAFRSVMQPLRLEIVTQTERLFRWRMTELSVAFRRATAHAASVLDCLQSEAFMRGLIALEYEATQRYLLEEGSSVLRLGIVEEYTSSLREETLSFRRNALKLNESKLRTKMEQLRVADLLQICVLMQHSARYALQSAASRALRGLDRDAQIVALLYSEGERRALLVGTFGASVRSLVFVEEQSRRRAIQLEYNSGLERDARLVLGRVHASMSEGDARAALAAEAAAEKAVLLEHANALGRVHISRQWALATHQLAGRVASLRLEATHMSGARRLALSETARRYVLEDALARALRADERALFMRQLTLERDVLLLVRAEAIERRAIAAQREISSQSIRAAPFVGAMARARGNVSTKEATARSGIAAGEAAQRRSLYAARIEAEEVVQRRDILALSHRALMAIARRLHRTLIAVQPSLRAPTGSLVCSCCSEPMLVPHTVVAAERASAARAAKAAERAADAAAQHVPATTTTPHRARSGLGGGDGRVPGSVTDPSGSLGSAPPRGMRARGRGASTTVTVPPALLAPPSASMRPIAWQPAGDESIYATRVQRVLTTLPFPKSRIEQAAATLVAEWSGGRAGDTASSPAAAPPRAIVTSPPSRAIRALRRGDDSADQEV